MSTPTPGSELSYIMVPQHSKSMLKGSITVSPRRKVHPDEPPISDLLYAGFLEHLGRCIYGGIVDDPAHPSPDHLLLQQSASGSDCRLAWRRDVMEVIGKKGELQVPMLRWPGGNFVSNYHWQDGVGPMSQRPRRIELAWLSDESNMFGTDEYIDYCRATGCEPYICLNMGTGSLEEALAWVEYCNGTGNTHWANLRRKHTGREEPHKVVYWGLGNEMWGPWQVGNMKAKDYAEKARIWAHGIRLVDPNVKLVSCGREGNDEWDSIVLDVLADLIDVHSIHFYTCLGQEKYPELKDYGYEANVFGPAAAEHNIDICTAMINMRKIRTSDQVDPKTRQRLRPRNIKIAFDEWNVWDEVKAPGSNGLAQTYDYTDMLGFVAWLHVLVRKHKDLALACLAQTVNVISPLMTSPTGLLRQTTFYPLRMFSRYMKGGYLLDVPPQQDRYDGLTYPMWISTIAKPAYVDVVAIYIPQTAVEGPSVRMSILNRHPHADYKFDLRFEDFELGGVNVYEMYSDDLSAANTFDNSERVIPSKKEYSANDWYSENLVVQKHSWKFFEFKGNEAGAS